MNKLSSLELLDAAYGGRNPRQSVLVVDDDPDCLKVCCRLLEDDGFLTYPAASGAEALGQVLGLSPNAVLLDIGLGKLSGLAICGALGHHPATRHIPVILMTGIPGPINSFEKFWKGLGCGRILRKPGDIIDLPRQIRDAIAQGQSAARVDIQLEKLRRGSVTADLNTHQVWVNDLEILGLRLRGFELLCFLMKQEKWVSRREILDRLWPDHETTGSVGSAIHRLKGTLARYPGVTIESNPEDGYRLVVKE